jgi:hypothetical protein
MKTSPCSLFAEITITMTTSTRSNMDLLESIVAIEIN